MAGMFYGWYLKCQSETQTLAVIPAIHGTGRNRTASVQLITDQGAWLEEFPGNAFRQSKHEISIGENRFGPDGLHLSVHTPELEAEGSLSFGSLSPLRYDIMGPFALVPFLECRHSVWSMRHTVSGSVRIQGQEYLFHNASGYWEGDRGRSFPREYAWSQCSFENGSLMVSVAEIPFLGMHFTGIIAAVLWNGQEYRAATYLGARASTGNRTLRITQGALELEARLLETSPQSLKAPTLGKMERTIHESAACKAAYRFQKAGNVLFSFETDRASFEYEYPS